MRKLTSLLMGFLVAFLVIAGSAVAQEFKNAGYNCPNAPNAILSGLTSTDTIAPMADADAELDNYQAYTPHAIVSDISGVADPVAFIDLQASSMTDSVRDQRLLFAVPKAG